MSLIACGSIHEGHEWFSDDSRRRQEIFVFGCSITVCEQFCGFANEGAKIYIDQVLLHEITFFLSVFSSSDVLAKITSILQLAGFGKKREETVKPTCRLCRK